jgi:hypothetical protein
MSVKITLSKYISKYFGVFAEGAFGLVNSEYLSNKSSDQNDRSKIN